LNFHQDDSRKENLSPAAHEGRKKVWSPKFLELHDQMMSFFISFFELDFHTNGSKLFSVILSPSSGTRSGTRSGTSSPSSHCANEVGQLTSSSPWKGLPSGDSGFTRKATQLHWRHETISEAAVSANFVGCCFSEKTLWEPTKFLPLK
jgi:hypothetical protein